MKKITENEIIYKDNEIIKFIVKSPKYGDKEIIIDSEDWDKVRVHRWVLLQSKTIKGFYVRSANSRIGGILLHRLILGLNNPEILVDHINHNTFDNRKYNLRECSPSKNLQNRGKQRNNTSGFKGVSWHVVKKRWISYIGFNNKKIYIGLFEDKILAAEAYNKKAVELFGDYAILNKIG